MGGHGGVGGNDLADAKKFVKNVGLDKDVFSRELLVLLYEVDFKYVTAEVTDRGTDYRGG